MSKKRKKCSGNKMVNTPKGDIPISAFYAYKEWGRLSHYAEEINSLPLFAKRIRIEKTKALLLQKTCPL
jgi:hypothetical protein